MTPIERHYALIRRWKHRAKKKTRNYVGEGFDKITPAMEKALLEPLKLGVIVMLGEMCLDRFRRGYMIQWVKRK